MPPENTNISLFRVHREEDGDITLILRPRQAALIAELLRSTLDERHGNCKPIVSLEYLWGALADAVSAPKD